MTPTREVRQTPTGRRASGDDGFTLIELLLATAIIAVLSLIAFTSLTGVGRSSTTVSLASSEHAVKLAAENYLATYGQYPPSLGVMVEEKYLEDPSDALVVPAGTARRDATTMTTKSWSLVYLPAADFRSYEIETGGPVTVPGAPTQVTGVPSNGVVAVSWHAPARDGGSPITKYTAVASPGNAACTTTDGLTCIVTGLQNGIAYTFKVTATNIIGDSKPSAASAAVVPLGSGGDADVPGAPRNVTGVRGNQQITVSWLPPSTDGNSPITGYTVTANNGRTCSTTGELSCVLTGLTNGTGYTFTAYATNANGNGPSFPAGPSVVPATTPNAPGSVVALPNDGAARISWSAITSTSQNGGDPVTGYTATASTGQSCTATGASTNNCTIPGLANGTTYTVTVTATNTVGTSPTSASVSVKPAVCTIRSISPTSLMQRTSTNNAAQTNASFNLQVRTVGNCNGTVTVVLSDPNGVLPGASTQTVTVNSTNTTTEVTSSKSVAANTITLGVRTNPGVITADVTHPAAEDLRITGIRVIAFSS